MEELATGSKFGRICKKRPETACASIVKDIVYPKSLKYVKAIQYGIEFEPIAKMTLREHGFEVEDSGLWMDPEVPGLAGSLDGIIKDVADGNRKALEIKNVYDGKDMLAEDAMKHPDCAISKAFFLD